MFQQRRENKPLAFVKNRLLTDSLHADNIWLTECLEFFLSEHEGITNEDLYKKTREQWLLSDLAEVGLGCLPNNVTTETKEFSLNGKFILQLQFLVDISESCYDQLNKLYNKKLDEVEEVKEYSAPIKKKRMFKLELTDGKKNVQGMEYTPISCLNTKLTPGCKILISGPIRCVNKVLFLGPKNVTILGGEVDSLLITNAYENILLKAVGKPINPKPKDNYTESLVSEEQRRPTVPIVTTPFNQFSTSNDESIDNMDDILMTINLDAIEKNALNRPSPPVVVKPSVIYFNPDDDDDGLFDDLDLMEQIENEIKTKTEVAFLQNEVETNSEISFLRNDITGTSLFRKPVVNSEIREPQPSCSSFQKPSITRQIINSPTSSSFFNKTAVNSEREPQATSSFFKKSSINSVQSELQPDRLSIKSLDSIKTAEKNENLDDFIDPSMFDDSQIFEMECRSILDDNYEYKINGINLVFIDQLMARTNEELKGKSFIVFGKVNKVAEKLNIINMKFNLSVFLTDNNSKQLLRVRMKSDLIEKLAGYTTIELIEMRKKHCDNPQAREESVQILSHLKNNIENLNCFMNVYFDENEYPILIKTIDKTIKTENLLKQKIKKEGG